MNNNKELINDYNGRDYRTVWRHPRAQFEDKFEGDLIKKTLTRQGGWFVDIGGGYGRLYPLVKRDGRKIVLVDYAMNLLEMAVKEYGHNEDVFFVSANAYHLPFKKGVFSGGVSVRVFHHMNLPGEFLLEVGRIMRGGAEMVMEYANKRNLFRIFRRGIRAFKCDHEEYEPLHYGTHPVFFKKITKEAGFRIVKTLGTGFFPRFIKEKTLFLVNIFTPLEIIFDVLFGRLNLAPLNFLQLKKQDEGSYVSVLDFKDILQCPCCAGELNIQDVRIVCATCHREFSKKGSILDLRYKP